MNSAQRGLSEKLLGLISAVTKYVDETDRSVKAGTKAETDNTKIARIT